MGLILFYLIVGTLVGGFAFLWDYHISEGTREERIEEALEYGFVHILIGLFWFISVPFLMIIGVLALAFKAVDRMFEER